jgi:peptidyl-prolyl cis-trans isomerase SurA
MRANNHFRSLAARSACAAIALLAAFAFPSAFAQFNPAPNAGPTPGVRPNTGPITRPGPVPAARSTDAVVPLDRVLAVVNDEALTQYEVDESKRLILTQMQTARVTPPPPETLQQQVLERLITERALMQFAKENGIRVDDQQVERTILRIAQENKLTPEEFRRQLAREKIEYEKYREDVRREITIQRLREREVESRLSVSDAEVANYLATVASQAGGENEYNLSHILVTVPEQAAPQQIDARRLRAEEALQQIKGGKEFAQVAAAFSDAPDSVQGGSLGWRTAARLPTVFTEAVRNLQKGDVSPVLRSPGGFHIVRLVDVRSRNAPTVVEQTHARHILIKVNEITSESEGKLKIDRIKDRLDGGAKFEDLAKVNSEDASASKGGDLGWLSPGDTVPEFDSAMAKLAVGQLSGPVRTPFGWHVILVQERRTQDITEDRKREQARQAIRQRKSEEQFAEFVRQTRDRAYVEYKQDDR